MKAAILNGYHKNGSELVLRDIPVPVCGSREVLVKIRAAGVNPLDNMIIRGEVKMIVPYRFPLVMGNEFVGVIKEVGAEVSGFSVGDRVYGRMPLDKIGAFAEYAAMTKHTTRPWRDNTEQAASPRPGEIRSGAGCFCVHAAARRCFPPKSFRQIALPISAL